jgi:hypothetical protein
MTEIPSLYVLAVTIEVFKIRLPRQYLVGCPIGFVEALWSVLPGRQRGRKSQLPPAFHP